MTMGTSQSFEKLSTTNELNAQVCPYCKMRKVRVLFSIKNRILYEKRICMNLECFYYEYKRISDELEVKTRLKGGSNGV
jgi:hypothetical protein